MFKYAHNARHTVFWYHDGSVVLVLEDMLFKLHASRLERESKYFADLFRGDPPQETMEGCPVYIVHGVSAADFTVLVETMEGAITYARSPPPFPVAAALLRASRALSFHKFTEFAVQVLHEMWSPDLMLVTSERKPYAADTIDLAVMCDVPEVFKRAYYELLRTPRFRQSVDGDDGNMRDDPSAPSTLGVLDYERLVAARSKLQDAWLQIALVPFGSDCPPRALPLGSEPADVRPYQSGESAQLWHKMVVQKPVFKEGMLDPLGALQTLIDIDWCELCYCKSCVGRQRKTWTEARERIWRDLDAWLGLG
ncbi:hypothetical protein SCP_0507630 [Sparassis crispa]|uniref:BTB domain-containing protein n=1 Tax=Sparassis crispa TaxID=139825 RepID=A0A401GNA0_9APHY|nr:hypothetical protein SCP_0507630 [Sparassis crispa]GBE83707.1 hypothetical protein SCP_0507630 [Sparassis crispa]